MACTDGLIEATAEKVCGTWVRKLLDSTDEIATFVATRRQRGDPERIVNYYKGSFNICIHIKFRDEGPDAIIRFPKEGLTSFRDEKVKNEVYVIEFLRQKTTIPLPRILSWGLTADSPQQLGPFIIMDYVEGTLLSDILKKPTRTN
jgi:aminoglycoside phosphotransferase (APT) family kinase protein